MRLRRSFAVLLLVLLVPLPAPTARAGEDWPGAVHLDRFPLGAHGPSRVAVDAEGRFYVTDPARHRLVMTDARGEEIVPVAVNGYPVGIAVGEDGRIYLGDGERRAVHVFGPEGGYLFALGAGTDEFRWPGDVTLDGALGRIYVADGEAGEVKVYDLDGNPSFSIAGVLRYPAAVAVDPPTGNVVVSDLHDWTLHVFDSDGAWVRSIGELVSPAGLCGDAQGVLYVAESFQGQVFAFDALGASLGAVGEFGEGRGQLRVPMDALLDPYGRLAVVSYNNGSLEIYGPEGYAEPPSTVSRPHLTSLRIPAETIPAGVVFKPGVLNLADGSRRLKAFVEFEEELPGEIDLSTVLLNGVVPAEEGRELPADLARDGAPSGMFFFDGQATIDMILRATGGSPADSFELVVTGAAGDARFEARNSIGILTALRSVANAGGGR